jgi:phosphoglycolate phosphatase-like HAD superfamily hydrolase
MANRASGLGTAGAPLLVLWDVDHTLIENGGISKAAYRRAFEMLTGRAPTCAVETDGRTDPLIMRHLLDRHGIEVEPGLLDRAMDVLPEALSSLVPQLREVGYPLPGAREALVALREQPGVIQSVLTGNVKANARLKLAAFDLHEDLDLDVGGYGSDAEDRASLVTVARSRASDKYRTAVAPESTVVVGDTLRDVQAGHGGGAYVVGVATGPVTMEELAAEGADGVLPDLRDTGLVVQTVLALGRVGRQPIVGG